MRVLTKERLASGTTRVSHKELNIVGIVIGSQGSIKSKDLRYLVRYDNGVEDLVPFGKLNDLDRPSKAKTEAEAEDTAQ
jgi:hypothetical protein